MPSSLSYRIPPPPSSSPSPFPSSPTPHPSDVYIFGYGSLCWRPDFPFLSRHPSYIEGYQRRFWQGSPDHRGTLDAPGRVVTLVRVDGGEGGGKGEDVVGGGGREEVRVYGMVYLVHREDVKAVLQYLDVREQGGYSMQQVTCHLLTPPLPLLFLPLPPFLCPVLCDCADVPGHARQCALPR